jgi:hypothetical protein
MAAHRPSATMATMFPSDFRSALLLADGLGPPLEHPGVRAIREARSLRTGRSLGDRIRAAIFSARTSVDTAPTVPTVLRDYPYRTR